MMKFSSSSESSSSLGLFSTEFRAAGACSRVYWLRIFVLVTGVSAIGKKLQGRSKFLCRVRTLPSPDSGHTS